MFLNQKGLASEARQTFFYLSPLEAANCDHVPRPSFDWTKEAVAKVQDALAEAECD